MVAARPSCNCAVLLLLSQPYVLFSLLKSIDNGIGGGLDAIAGLRNGSFFFHAKYFFMFERGAFGATHADQF